MASSLPWCNCESHANVLTIERARGGLSFEDMGGDDLQTSGCVTLNWSNICKGLLADPEKMKQDRRGGCGHSVDEGGAQIQVVSLHDWPLLSCWLHTRVLSATEDLVCTRTALYATLTTGHWSFARDSSWLHTLDGALGSIWMKASRDDPQRPVASVASCAFGCDADREGVPWPVAAEM